MNIIQLQVGSYQHSVFAPFLIDFSFSKDFDSPKGTGKISVAYDSALYDRVAKDMAISVATGWHISTTQKNHIKSTCSGVITKVSIRSDTIECEFEDLGRLLEANAVVNYSKKKRSFIIKDLIKKSGLIPVVDLGSTKDDVIDFSSESSSSGEDGVKGKGKPSCSRCPKEFVYKKTYESTAENKCPLCGKTGAISFNPKGTKEGEFTCDTAKGGCGGDMCIICGNEKMPKSRGTIKLLSGPTEVTVDAGNTAAASTTTASTTTTDTKDTSTTSSASTTSSGSTYWDMLVKLCDPSVHDLQIFVWLNKCYVQPVPPAENAVLWIDDTKNVIADSVTIEEGNPTSINAVRVNYGKGKHVNSVMVKEEFLYKKYGPKVKTFNKYSFSEKEAKAFASKQLNLLGRDSEFNIDCSVLGSPEWYICRWAKSKFSRYGFIDTYYITRFNTQISANDIFKTDLSLKQYRPTVSSDKTEGSSDPETVVAKVAQKASKFHYSHSCSDAKCLESTNKGDCYAMSDYIFEALKAEKVKCRIIWYCCPNHRSVQYYSNGTWVDFPYKQNNFERLFRTYTPRKNLRVYKES